MMDQPLIYGLNTETAKKALDIQEGAQRKLVRKYLKFLPDAEAARGRSKDRSTQVGAVVLDDDFNVRISGYNGMPRGINDEVEARHQRPLKYDWTAHSEENCVAQAARVGVSLKGCTILLTSLFPCTGCSRMIIQAGIKRVLAPSTNIDGTNPADRMDWDEKALIAMEMLTEAGVEIVYYNPEDLK
jgi:dCMP deaminase